MKLPSLTCARVVLIALLLKGNFHSLVFAKLVRYRNFFPVFICLCALCSSCLYSATTRCWALGNKRTLLLTLHTFPLRYGSTISGIQTTSRSVGRPTRLGRCVRDDTFHYFQVPQALSRLFAHASTFSHISHLGPRQWPPLWRARHLVTNSEGNSVRRLLCGVTWSVRQDFVECLVDLVTAQQEAGLTSFAARSGTLLPVGLVPPVNRANAPFRTMLNRYGWGRSPVAYLGSHECVLHGLWLVGFAAASHAAPLAGVLSSDRTQRTWRVWVPVWKSVSSVTLLFWVPQSSTTSIFPTGTIKRLWHWLQVTHSFDGCHGIGRNDILVSRHLGHLH